MRFVTPIGAIAILSLPLFTFAQSNANVQVTVLPEPPLPVGDARKEPAPPWLVWKVFYNSLEFYERQSPTAVTSLLTERAALSDTEIDFVRAAGRQYLQQLASLDNAAIEEVRAKYQPNQPSIVMRSSPNASSSPRAPSQPAGLPARLPDGRRLADAVQADGSVQRLMRNREQAAQAHLQTLSRRLDSKKLAAIQALVDSEVAPKVHVVTSGRLVAGPTSIQSPVVPPPPVRGN